MNDIIEFLKKHDYLITAQAIEHGCVVTYPARRISPRKKPRVVKYELGPEQIIIEEDNVVKELDCPEYTHRSAILLSIANQCAPLNYHLSAIDIKHISGRKSHSLLEILNVDLVQDIQKEIHLRILTEEIVHRGTITKEIEEKAEKYDIREGIYFLYENFLRN